MYFAVIGNHPHIALKELALAEVFQIEKRTDHLFTFSCKRPEKLPQIASLVKWGVIVEVFKAEHYFNGKRLLGTADSSLGINWKKKYHFKRFKKVDLLHTDREIKEKGVEILPFPRMKGFIGVVQGYQNIPLYECIDFEKPARSMQVGMMPAKLTHTLINLALQEVFLKDAKGCPVIRDPFCGTGTTGFLVNSFGYDFVGSDLKIGLAEKNAQRWKSRPEFHDQLFDFFEQDISKPLERTTHTEALLQRSTAIVTEGRLGPVIKQTTTIEQLLEYQRWVKNLYVQFLQTVADFFRGNHGQLPVLVFTIPVYTTLNAQQLTIEKEVTALATKLGWNVEALEEAYQREGQKVARKIMMLRSL